MKMLALALTLTLLAVACSPQKRWLLTVYEGGNNMLPTHIGEFESAAQCSAGASPYMAQGYTYECAKNCRPWNVGPDGIMTYMCDETFGSPSTGLHSSLPDIGR